MPPDNKATDKPVERKARFYFGGLAGTCAVFVTHPLDLIKVNLQTQKEKTTIAGVVKNVVQKNGVMGLYNGISAACLRQMSYTLSRFGAYDAAKVFFSESTFLGNIGLACVSGLAAAIVGTPADCVNVRMQNDVKLPPNERRNYKNAFEGLYRVCKEEGFMALYNGIEMGVIRGVVLTVGQIMVYNQVKRILITNSGFKDNLTTHFTASLVAAGTATLMTQPVDVLKTRMQNSKPGEYNGSMHLISETVKEGPAAFFKGFIPALARLGPQTILTFVILEQLRINFGIPVEKKPPPKKK